MNKMILKLAVPNIISNITVPLIGLVDLALMGHLGADKYIGAIALGTIIFNFIYWGFGFLRMSVSGFTAQSVGAQNNRESALILLRGLLISVGLSLLIILLQIPIERLSFKFIEGSAEVEQLAAAYFRIRIWAAPATLGLYVLNGWFLGMQNARLVMISSVLSNVFNVLFSYLFVYVWHFNSSGVALGTVLAQYLGLFVSLIFLRRNYGDLFQCIDMKGLLNIDFLKRFFRVNTDIFIRTLCVILVFSLFTSKSAGINDHVLAVNTILLQFLMFFSFFIDGLAFAGEALVGKFVGSDDLLSFRRLFRRLWLWGFMLALIFSVFYWLGNRLIISVLTDNEEIYQTVQTFLPWVVLLPLVSFGSYVWDGIYIGFTASRPMRNSMLAASILLFAPAFFFLPALIGSHALWLSLVLFLLGRTLFQTFLFPRVLREAFGSVQTRWWK
ncbi:MAG: MATE family efflux transporter [Mangrovibacterium sp.]